MRRDSSRIASAEPSSKLLSDLLIPGHDTVTIARRVLRTVHAATMRQSSSPVRQSCAAVLWGKSAGKRWVMKIFLFAATHVIAIALGFAAGIYVLPIWTAPDSPSAAVLRATADNAQFSGAFRRDLADSDALHWGEGKLSISAGRIVFEGSLAPGPDYRLYLSPEFVETEAAFNRLKAEMVQAGAVRTFDNFVVNLPDGIDPADYTTAVVWCETFGQFISAVRYR